MPGPAGALISAQPVCGRVVHAILELAGDAKLPARSTSGLSGLPEAERYQARPSGAFIQELGQCRSALNQ